MMSHMLTEEVRIWLLLTLGSARMSQKREIKTRKVKTQALCISVWL